MSVAGVVAALHGRCSSLFESVGLRSLILNAPLGFSNLDHATIPLHVVATDIERAEVLLSRGPALATLLASTAIPGILPPVDIGGRALVDGGRTGERAVARGRRAGSGGDSREGAARGGGRVIQPFPTFSEVFLGAMLELRKRAAA
jgi:NTE family protein